MEERRGAGTMRANKAPASSASSSRSSVSSSDASREELLEEMEKLKKSHEKEIETLRNNTLKVIKKDVFHPKKLKNRYTMVLFLKSTICFYVFFYMLYSYNITSVFIALQRVSIANIFAVSINFKFVIFISIHV